MTETTTSPPPPAPPAPGTESAVAIRSLNKRYGQVRAVDELSLQVPAGSVFGLVGPNGAGKTTTMQAIVTLLRPDSGDIRVFGADPVTEPREVRAKVGYVPDTFGLYDGLSCAEYLDFFGSAYHLPTDVRREQVTALLELVELSHRADADVSTLSRGMQQRLSLARALVHDPPLLVLDEPASGLDPRARVELREILLQLARDGATILISSHILAELDEMCDRVGIIEAGRVLAQGTPAEIRRALTQSRTLRIRVLGDDDALAAAVTAAATSGAVAEVVDGRLRCEIVGDDEEVAALLSALVAAGVRITDFREEQSGLEHLFLRVTQGIVR